MTACIIHSQIPQKSRLLLSCVLKKERLHFSMPTSRSNQMIATAACLQQHLQWLSAMNMQPPEEQLFVVTHMREHLHDCIEEKMMKHFPAKKRRCTNKARKTETLKVFCHCRLPAKENMVLCERCQEWFQDKCEIIPDEVWTNDKFKWYCSKCNF